MTSKAGIFYVVLCCCFFSAWQHPFLIHFLLYGKEQREHFAKHFHFHFRSELLLWCLYENALCWKWNWCSCMASSNTVKLIRRSSEVPPFCMQPSVKSLQAICLCSPVPRLSGSPIRRPSHGAVSRGRVLIEPPRIPLQPALHTESLMTRSCLWPDKCTIKSKH